MVRDDVTKRAHPFPLLGVRHPKRARERVRRLAEVIRIDDQRLLELAGRPRELAQNENAPLVVARRDDFLRFANRGEQLFRRLPREIDEENGLPLVRDELRRAHFDLARPGRRRPRAATMSNSFFVTG